MAFSSPPPAAGPPVSSIFLVWIRLVSVKVSAHTNTDGKADFTDG
jgi:hypothetical protein